MPDAPSPPNLTLALAALSLGMLALGTTSLVVLGLGYTMTNELGVAAGSAGTLVTAFALPYAIMAPLLQFAIGGRVQRRPLIMTGLCLVGAGSFWGAVAGSFEELLTSRVLAAVGAALVGPTSSAAGAAIVPEAQRGRALAAVFAGFTLATVVGVPAATWISLTLGWRGAMACVGLLALMAAIAIAATLRDRNNTISTKPNSFFDMLTRLRLLAALGTSTMHLAAQFTIYALMAALLVDHFNLRPQHLPIAIFLFGLGGVLGNAAAGVLTDRYGASRIIAASFAGLGAMFALLSLPLSAFVAAIAVAGCAASGTLFTAPQQVRLTGLVSLQEHASVLALNASAGSIGLAVGSSVASFAYGTFGAATLPIAALTLLLPAAILFLLDRHLT